MNARMESGLPGCHEVRLRGLGPRRRAAQVVPIQVLYPHMRLAKL